MTESGSGLFKTTSLQFDGVDDGAIAENATIQDTSHLTLSTKVQTIASGPMTLVAQEDATTGGYYRVVMNEDGTVTFSLGDSTTEQFSIMSTVVINDGKVHHLALQREGRTGLLWIDGELQAAVNGASVVSLGDNGVTTIGYQDDTHYFQGEIESLRITSESLSETDIFGYAAPDETIVGAYREAITAEADSISGQVVSGFLASRISVTGRHSFGLYGNETTDANGNTRGDRAVVAAATEWGAGRLVLHGAHRLLETDRSTTQYETEQFLRNAIDWLGRTDDKTIRIVTDNSWNGQMERWLATAGYTNVVRSSTWWNELDQADVYIGSIENVDRSQAVREFVKAGGGLLTGRSWWGGFDGTRQTLEGSGLQLNSAGVGASWITELGSVSTEYAHAIKGLELFQHGNTDNLAAQKDAAQALIETYRHLPNGDPLREEIETVALARTESINPTRDNPFPWTEFDRAALKVETEILQTAAPSDVTKHRNAEASYGEIPENAPRVDQTATIDLTQPLTSSKKHSTGIYIPPGEVVTVTLPEQLVGSGAYFQINNHTDSIYARSQLTRFPEGVSRSFKIDSTEMEIANAFGGFVYLVIPKNQSQGIVSLDFQNTLDAPYFVLGETTDAEWNASIKHNPAPYAEIVTGNLFITLPSDRIRDLENPTELAMAWEQVELAQDYVRGIENTAFRFEGINVDVQISVGAAHSGYPVQAPQGGWGEALVNLDALLEYGSWGWFHELGHQHQRSYTKTDGDGEHTVNVFSMASNDALGSVPGSPGWGDMWDPARRVLRFESTPGGFREMGVGERLVMNAQLSRTFGWDAYRNIYLTYETDPDNRPQNEQEERDQWLIRWSVETGRDLTPFFDAWQYGHSQDAIDAVAAMNLPEWSMIEVLDAKEDIRGQINSTVTFSLTDNVWTPAENGALAIALETPVQGGMLVDNNDGTFTFIPDEDYVGRQQLDFKATNDDGGEAFFSITLETTNQLTRSDGMDLTISPSYPDLNRATRSTLFIDGYSDGSIYEGVLLKYDGLFGTSENQIKAGSQITSAKLEFTVTDPGSSIHLHRLLRDWNDDDTWNQLDNGISLDDSEALAEPDLVTSYLSTGLQSLDVTHSVQAWSNDPTQNFGWFFKPTSTNGVDIDSSESINPPRLIVSFADAGTIPEAINDKPVTEDLTASTDEDQIIAIDVLAHTTDTDAEDRNVNTVDLFSSVIEQPKNGRVHRLPDGKLAFIPDDNFNGTDSFTYQVSDGIDDSNISTVHLTVNDINDSPVTPEDRPTTDQNTAVTFNPLTNDVDVDGSINVNSMVFINPPPRATVSPDGKTLIVPNQGIYTIGPNVSTINTHAVDTIVSSNAVEQEYSSLTNLQILSARQQQGLLRFDDLIGTGLDQVPTGMEIISATLEYSLDDYGSVVDLHRMLRPWNDTDGWNALEHGIQLNDIEASRAKEFSIAHRNFNTHSQDVTDTVRDWIANPDSNYGWAIAPTGTDSMKISSAEGSRPPQLNITYAAPDALDETISITNQNAVDTIVVSDDAEADYSGRTDLQIFASQPTLHGLLRFDDLTGNGAGQIPDGMRLTSATLEYSLDDYGSVVDVHKMLTPWNDTDSWSDFEDGISRDNTEASSTKEFSIAHRDRNTHTQDVTDTVLGWLAEPHSNHGWAFVSTGSDSMKISSSEGDRSPRLLLTYAPIDSINSGDITFTPEADFSGVLTPISYQVEDNQGASSTGKITVTVHSNEVLPIEKTVNYTLDTIYSGTDLATVELDESGDLLITGSALSDSFLLREARGYLNVINQQTPSTNNGMVPIHRLNVDVELSSLTGAIAIDVQSGHNRVNARYLNQSVMIQGGDESDRLIGGTAGDTILGGAGGDRLDGNSGNDLIAGGGDNDIIQGGLGADTLNGGDGIDALDYTGSDTGVTVNLSNGNAAGGDAQGDIISGFERIVGSQYDDSLIGDQFANVLLGQDGDDTILGESGNDFIRGGIGADQLDGGDGSGDAVDYQTSSTGVIVNLLLNTASGGEAEGDTITGFERVYGSQHADHLTGANDHNHLYGYDGNDSLFGGAGTDLIRGGVGADRLDGGDGTADTLDYRTSSTGVIVSLFNNTARHGDAEGDVITNFERIYGSNDADQLTGSDDHNVLYGYSGNDILSGLAGNDRILGLAGNDRIRGGEGADSLDGGDGIADTVDYLTSKTGVTVNLANHTASGGDAEGDTITNFERIYGSHFSDVLIGSDQNNLLYSYGGDDTLSGGAGNDRIRGGEGADSLDGGIGTADTIDYLTSSTGVIVNLLKDIAMGGDADGDAIANFERVYGSNHADYLTGSETNNFLYGFDGNDIQYGLAGNDRILGLLGNDRIRGGEGADSLDGGEGLADTVDYLTSSASVIVNLSNHTARGGDAEGDVIANFERAYGSHYSDRLTGSSGNNLLYGYGGDDTLSGGAGNDVFRGGDGADLLIGGSGVNTYYYPDLSESLLSDYDTISDFKIGTDRVNGPSTISEGDITRLTTVSTLDEVGIGAVLNTKTFRAGGAAIFTFGIGDSQQTFLALNDDIGGFQPSHDALIEITGFSGLVENLSIL